MSGPTGFKEVQLFRKSVIGIGAYGSVCKAQCDELVCAAKIIHPTLITDHPGEKSPQGRFRKECEFLSTFRHPNVVQYLGTWQDTDTNLPVLLMELMDQSLTQFLAKFQTIVPFHTQVNICHDIALAISFLHSNGIIHRDLSSNNVLMIGDRRAKVTDFGMARLGLNPKATKLSLSMCPGTDVYMPPEAIREKPKYTEKIDCFSFGVLAIQILSRRFPSPGNRVKNVIVGGRELLEPQTEYTRREEDIKIVDTTNPLLPIACDCLKDKEEERPSAKDLCTSVATLQEDSRYVEKEGGEMREKDEELRRLKSEWDATIKARDSRIELLESTLQARNEIIEAKNAEIQRLEERLNTSQKENMELLKEKVQATALTDTVVVVHNKKQNGLKDMLEWRKGTDAPCVMDRSSDAIVCGSFVYVRPNTTSQLYVYNWEADSWTELLRCPTDYSTLANVKNALVVIGGFQQNGEKTNKLFNLSTSNKNFTWVELYPPMPTKRDSAIATCYGTYLVVAGGIEKTYLNIVEVLHAETKQWHRAANLPSKMFSGSAAICGDQLYILGGWVSLGTSTFSLLTCSLGSLMNSCSPVSAEVKNEAAAREEVWGFGTKLPVTKSTCVSLQNQLLVIGGQDKSGDPTRKVWVYEPISKLWVEYGECQQARSQCYAAVLPSNELMIVGGFTKRHFTGETSSTEIAARRTAA